MDTLKIKCYAKVNLTLDVWQKKEKYHPIKSLVSTIGIYDDLIIKRRNDYKVTLKTKGNKLNVPREKNNAYIAVAAFMKKHKTFGADVTLIKRIPESAGLGGSSADIAGALKAMNELYETQDDLESLASSLGSDVNFLLEGGFCEISGRGEMVEKLPELKKQYVIVLTAKQGVGARECYEIFDNRKETPSPVTDIVKEEFLKTGEINYKLLKNDLTLSAKSINAQIGANEAALKAYDCEVVLMSGSGSAVYGIFSDEKKRDSAYRQLKKFYKKNIIKTETV